MRSSHLEAGGAPSRWGVIEVRDGLRLRYRDYCGPPGARTLLCLHGLTRNSRDFVSVAERYSSRVRVIALDFRGRGESDCDPVPARYVPPTYAADVIELLDHLALDEAIFLGTSLGGLVTMAVAVMAPQRIRASILNDVGPELSDAGLDRIRSYLGRDAQFSTWEEAAATIAGYQNIAFPGRDHSDWLAMARRTCREDNGEIRFDYDPAIAVPFETSGPAPSVDLWPFFLALAKKPLLVLRGEVSDLLSADAMERMRVAAPTASFATIPGVGHAPELTEPEALTAIDGFLDHLLAAGESPSA